MTLKHHITEEMNIAMRAIDSESLGTIRLLLAEIKRKEVDERIEVDDVQVVAIIDKMIKQRKDSIAAFSSAGRDELAAKEATEITVIQAYLPARMSVDEIATAVQAIIARVGATGPADMGKAMGAVKAELAGKAEMGQLSAAVKAALGS